MKIIALLTCLLLAGCFRVPSLSVSDAADIESAAYKLLARSGSSEVASTEWPREIRILEPEVVRVASDGVYIVTSSFFVQEAGLFIPREAAVFVPVVGSDPEYRRQHGNVFSYRIRG